MKYLMLIVGAFFIYTHIGAQTLLITDQESGAPLELVTLYSEKPRAFAETNIDGKVDISDFQGSERITIQLLGYDVVNQSYEELGEVNFQLSLSSTTLGMEEVIVSASRWNQTTAEVPSKIISISARSAALQNPQTAADLLGLSGKVFIQKSQQGGGSPMIRGFATNRLLYTVDGVRMNTAIFRGGNIQNVISLDPFATERTEVLFGPGSVIYGSDAIGGVMSFQTLTPKLSLNDEQVVSGKALTRYASANDEKTAHFDINLGGHKWAMLTSISSNDYGDLKMGTKGPEEYLRPFYVQRQDSVDVIIANDDPMVQRPSGYTQINMMQKVRFQPNDQWDIRYGFHYSETSKYSRYDRHIRYRNGAPRYGEWDYGPQKWMMNLLKITHANEQKFYDQASLRVAQQQFKESRISRDFNKVDREHRIEEVDAYSANLDFVKSTAYANELFYGVEVVWNDVKSIGINENIETGKSEVGPARYPQADWASYGAYVTTRHRFGDKLLMQAGLRYNQFQVDARFDTTFYPFPFTDANLNQGSLTGSLGWVYRPDKSWVFNANLSRAFRAPNVDDIGKVFDSEPGIVVVPNPDLDAENAYNVDFGIAKVINKKVKLDATVFYTLLDNALVRRDFLLNGMDSIIYDGTLSRVQAIQNAAQARVYGIQLGIEAKLGAGFSFSSDLSYQKGEEELDDGETSPSRHAAPLFGVSRLTYSTPQLQLQFYASYSGEVSYENLPESEQAKGYLYAIDENGKPYSPSWYTLNFKAFYRFTEHLSLSAGLENLTNQRYRPYSSGIVAPGRNLILALRADF